MEKRGTKGKKPSPYKRGRPSHQQQIEMEETCKDYFVRNLSAWTCHNETGFRKDAVYDYYNKFAAEVQDDKGYIQRQIVVKERYGIALDQLQLILEKQMKRLQNLLKPTRFNRNLETSLTYTIQTLAKIYNDKANVEITPTLDISLRKVIKERWGIDLDQLAQKQPSK